MEASNRNGSKHDRLYPLTEENCPKALLPVANLPILYYQLQWLENSGIDSTNCFKIQ
jgi:NDP-sugar pyrophosphorylase family protein